MYIVLADKGPLAQGSKKLRIVSTSHSEKRTVSTARRIEELGDKFEHDNGGLVEIIQISEEHEYLAENDPVTQQETVFRRLKVNGSWTEEWPNRDFQNAHDGKKKKEAAIAA